MDLSPAEIVAVSGAFKDDAVKKAKDSLNDNSNHAVDLTIRVQANVSKAAGKAASVSMVAQTVCLTGFTTLCCLLRSLGYGPKRVKEALEGLPPLSEQQVDAELSAVFDEVAAERAKKLPQMRVENAGKRGSVTVTAQVTKKPAKAKK